MRSLKEFLEEEAEKLKTEPPKGVVMRDEWVVAVDRLMDQILGWVTEADQKHVLTIEERTVAIREEIIGSYEVRALTIILGVRSARVEPIARGVAGPLRSTGGIHVSRAFGRVDLTNGITKYMLFRTAKEPDGPWIIVKQDGYRMNDFDQQSFESALQGLLD